MLAGIKDYFDLHLPPDAQGKDKLFFALNALIPALMGIYIFINPLPLDSVSELCYYLSCVALITLLLFRKTTFTLRSPLSIGLGLFFLWTVLGLFTTLDFSNTLHDLRGYLLEYLVIFYLFVNFYNSRNRLEFLSDLIIASAMLFSVGGLIVFYGIEGNSFSTRFGQTFAKMYTGFMCFTTIFAAILSLRGVYRPGSMLRQAVYFFCFLVLTMTTVLNQSRGVVISLCVALLIMCLHRKKTIILIAVAGIMIAFTPGYIDRISTGFTQDIRSKMFRLSWEVIKDNPIAGVGYGGEIYRNPKLIDLEKYNASLPEKYQQKEGIINSTHNTFLDVAIRTGLVGLTLFCLVVLTALWMLWDIFFRRRSDEFFRSWSICLFACLASIMIINFFADALYGAQGIILYINLAMIGILWNLARQCRSHT
ncbi:MAG: O-antigen ligase family protein [Smithellaceae bacterium]|nr:O-antigen ligase family protein [Smithellaceae bacterium]